MHPNSRLPCVVTIAGTDPSGGAGIQADIKAISATGAYAASIVTALVAQNTQGVQSIFSIPETFFQQQMDAVFDDLEVHAVKIGMLQDARIIDLVARQLEKLPIAHVVFDPVMVAKDGSILLDLDTVSFLKRSLLKQVTLITPNFFEAEYLSNTSIKNLADMEKVAIQIGQQCQTNVLLKGGHLDSKHSPDILYSHLDNCCHWFQSMRITTHNTHGTGCTLSSAIASYLAQGFGLVEAITRAKEYIFLAIESGARYAIGKGCGPVDHFYFLENRKTL